MKIGIRAHDFGCLPPVRLAEKMAAQGVEAAQLAIPKAIAGVESYAQVTDGLLREIGAAFREHHIDIAVLGCYIEPSLPDEAARKAQLDTFRLGLRCAAELGAGCVGTETTLFSGPEQERPAAYDILRRSVDAMLNDAAKLGVTVAVEPVAAHTLNSPALAARLLQEFRGGGLAAIFDAVNLLTPARIETQAALWDEALAAFGPDIAAVHVKDAVVKDGALAPALLGEGVMCYDNIMRWLAQHKPGVLDKANALYESLKTKFRVKLDDTDNSPGWKFSQYEMQGVPLRLEIGPKDIEQNQCVLVRRDTREKIFVSLDNLEGEIEKALQAVHDGLYERALKNLEEKTFTATTYEEFLDIAENKPGFIKAMWCGDSACEDKLKDATGGVKSRCIPFKEEHLSDVCVCCGKPAKHMVYWGRQY